MRIVLFRTDKIGDMIVTTPVFAAIKAKYPQAKIMLVAAPYNVVAVAGLDTLDEIILFDERGGKQAIKDTLKKIRAFKPTHALVVSPRHECYMMAMQSGARQQGWIYMEYRFLTKLLAHLLLPKANREEVTRDARGMHHSEHILNLARRMRLAAAGEFPYAMARDAVAADTMRAQLKQKGITGPFIAVHLVDKWVDENWTPQDIKVFLGKVRAQTGLALVATAGPADKIIPAALAGDLPIFSNLSFGEWAALFELSTMVIAPDCAAVHMACALQKPLLALYQPSRMQKAFGEYGPRHTHAISRAITPPQEAIPQFLGDVAQLLLNPSKHPRESGDPVSLTKLDSRLRGNA